MALVAVVLGGLTTTALTGPITTSAQGVIDDAADAETTVATDLDTPAEVGSARRAAPVRITTRIEQREVAIPAPIEHRDDELLPVGATRIDTAGVPGTRHETVEIVWRNGEVFAETVVSTILIAPTPVVVAVGTATSESATKDWAALAECESGGDPTIVSSSGRYHGLYQFDVSTWRSVGGGGLPSQAPADEQTARAMALYDERGASPWPTCGRHL